MDVLYDVSHKSSANLQIFQTGHTSLRTTVLQLNISFSLWLHSSLVGEMKLGYMMWENVYLKMCRSVLWCRHHSLFPGAFLKPTVFVLVRKVHLTYSKLCTVYKNIITCSTVNSFKRLRHHISFLKDSRPHKIPIVYSQQPSTSIINHKY